MSVRFFSNFIKERRYIIYKILLTILFVFSSFFYLFSEAKASEVNNNLALYNDPTVSGLTKPRLCNGTCTTGGATLGQIYSFNWAWSIPDSVRAQITKYQLKVNSTINERAPEPNGTSPLYVYEFNGFKVGENVITVRICTNSGCGPWSDPLTLNINRGWSILCTVYHPTVSIDTIASNSGVIYKPSSALSLFTTDSDLGTVATFLGAKVGTKATLSLKGANGTCSQNINGSFIRNNITSSTFLGTATNKKRNLEITCTSGCANTGSVVTVNTTGGSTNTGNTVTPPPPTQLTSCFGTQPPVSQTVMSQNLPGKFIFGNGPFTTGSDLGKIAAFLGVPIGQSVNLQISDAGCIGTYNYDVRNFVTAIGWITPWRGMNVTCVGGCGTNSGTGSTGGTNNGTGSTGNTGNTTGGSSSAGDLIITSTDNSLEKVTVMTEPVGFGVFNKRMGEQFAIAWHTEDVRKTNLNNQLFDTVQIKINSNTEQLSVNETFSNSTKDTFRFETQLTPYNGYKTGDNKISVRLCKVSSGCGPWSYDYTLRVGSWISCGITAKPVTKTVTAKSSGIVYGGETGTGSFRHSDGKLYPYNVFGSESDFGAIATYLGAKIGTKATLEVSRGFHCPDKVYSDTKNGITTKTYSNITNKIGGYQPGVNMVCTSGCTGSTGGTNTGSTGNTGNTTGGSTNTGTQAGSAPTSANIVGISHASRPLNSYLTLLWSGDSKTTHYNLKVNTKIITGNISYTNASYLVNSQNGFQVGENSIYVRACNSAGCSPWSNPRTLTVTGDGVSGIDGGSIEINNNLSIYNEPLNTKFPKPKINGSGGNVKQSVYFGQSLSLFWAWSIPLSISYDSYQIKVNSTITEYDASSPTFSSKVTNLYVNDIIGFSVADDNKLSVRVCDVNGCSQWSDPMTIDVWLGWTKNMCSSSPIGLSIKVRVNNEGVIYGSGTSNSPFTTDSDLGTIAAFMGNKIGDVVTMNTDYNSMCMSTNDDTKVTKNGITTTPYNVNIRDQKRTMLVKCVEGCNGSGTGSTGSVSTVTPVFPSSGTATFQVVGADDPKIESGWISGVDVGVRGNIMVVTLGSAGIRIVDISNVSSPKVLSELKLVDNDTSSSIQIKSQKVVIYGTKAYVRTNNGVFIVDISDPSKPEILGKIGDSKIHGMTVANNYVYTVGKTLQIWDVSNPKKPIVVGDSALPSVYYSINSTFAGVYVANQMAFVYYGFGSGVEIFDVRDVTKIKKIAGILTDKASYGIVGNDGYYYVSSVKGLEITEPLAPINNIDTFKVLKIIGKFVPSELVLDSYKGIEFYNGKVYAVNSKELQVIDVSNKEKPKLTKTYPVRGTGLVIDNGVAFMSTRDSSVVMIKLE